MALEDSPEMHTLKERLPTVTGRMMLASHCESHANLEAEHVAATSSLGFVYIFVLKLVEVRRW
jgi:hypothetical protein